MTLRVRGINLRAIVGAVCLGLVMAGCGIADRPEGMPAVEAAARPGPTMASAPEAGRDAGRPVALQLFLSAEGPLPGSPAFEVTTAPGATARIDLNSIALRPLYVSVTCEGPATLHADGRSTPLAGGATQTLGLRPQSRGAVRLILPADTAACRLDWNGHSLTLDRAAAEGPGAPAQPVCPRPAAGLAAGLARAQAPVAADDALAAVFHADGPMAQTCVLPAGPWRLLPDEAEALNARVVALTGHPLPESVLLAADPDMPLDFADAPKLRAIVLSYLHLRADFSGYLMLRMLAHHAAAGTQVRILLTASATPGPERRMLESFAARHPAIQLRYLRGPVTGAPTPGNLLDGLSRFNHAKIFATLAEEPGLSRLIVGGRNIHDGYFLDAPAGPGDSGLLRDFTGHATQDGIVSFHRYRDLEIEVAGDAIVQAAVAQFDWFWRSGVAGPPVLPAAQTQGQAAQPAAVGAGVRHFLSVPWADGRAQEQWFVDLIDAAEREILVVTPFENPPPAVESALVRAALRGVQVRMVIRQEVLDAATPFVTELNHRFAARFADLFTLFGHVPVGGRMLHGKFYIIDGRLGIVTSTNLNQRSFLLDTENGLVFLDPAMVAPLRAEFDALAAQSVLLTRDRPEHPLLDPLMAIEMLWRHF